MTHCTQESFEFPRVNRRVVEANFAGGDITSDGGVLLLRQADRLLGLSDAMALGFEDLNDHEALRQDIAIQTAVERDQLLASASTLCRFDKKVKIIFRGDGGFCRWKILRWCDHHEVGYIVGLAKNKRLNRPTATMQDEAAACFAATGSKVRWFSEFRYAAKCWDRPRRVIAKIEYSQHGVNPRYVVTILEGDGKRLYDKLYCAGGRISSGCYSPHSPTR